MSSLTEADWKREAHKGWNPSARLLGTLRGYDRLKAHRGPISKLRRALIVLQHRFWSAVTGADLPLGTSIGGGLSMPHPSGVVIHPSARVGVNCLIMQGVTIGTNVGPGAPDVGPGCDIGPGARVLGPIKLGARVMVAANAVVTKDVPAQALAVGVPAKILTDWNDRRTVFEGQAPRERKGAEG